MATRELDRSAFNGWLAVGLLFVAGVGLGYWWANLPWPKPSPWDVVEVSIVTAIWALLCGGFFALQPNMAAVLTLFGRYCGTVKQSGFHWANPLFSKRGVSLRAHNLNGQTIKVNDHRGNPIEIAAVIVWRVTDTAQAVFDVEDYVSYVTIQSESALRHLASAYPYDATEEGAHSLRGSMDEVSLALQKELQDRVGKAGVTIDEARLSHLAYAPEIAGVMLQRQQAEAVISARTRIVEGAVGMVEMALQKLEEHATIKLDEERRAAMVSNLLVVLCGERAAHPIVNAGTLYTG